MNENGENNEIPERWIPNALWNFDQPIDVERLNVINETRSAHLHRQPLLMGDREARKSIIQADFMETFEVQGNYLVKKGKRGSKDRHYELMCPADDPARARVCSYGAKFKWEEDGSATLLYLSLQHGEGCRRTTSVPTNRCKSAFILAAAKKGVYDALKDCKDSSRQSVVLARAKIEDSKLAVVPSMHTVKR